MHSVAATVYRWWQERGESEAERQYLGASVLGGECERALWYAFRQAGKPKFDGRMYRLFNRGQREEATVIEELRGIGCEVSDTAPDGNQWGFVALGGHFKGHIDAAVRNTPYAEKTWAVLEVKTHSAKSFKDLTDKGVEKAHPKHFAQMQVYMGQLGMERALYYAVNKDNDQIHTEWLHFSQEAYAKLMEKAARIISAAEPPLRLSNDPSWWQCKFCDFHGICHGQEVPRTNCRTCAHSTPEREGGWSCAKQQPMTPGCKQHRYIPILLDNVAEYLGCEDGENPLYRNRLTGAEFTNGAWSSDEIHAAQDKRAIGDPGVDEFRQTFGAKVAA